MPGSDRLPIGSFHRRVLWLVGLGMFLDACDIYLAGGVLGSLVKSGWSDLAANARFMSATFLGMLCGTFAAGWLGDRYGRRYSYQVNLMLFGLASVAAAFAPNMTVLIAIRFVMGIGLGAEIVVGYSSLAEFMPRAKRGRYVALLSMVTNLRGARDRAGRRLADPGDRLAVAVRHRGRRRARRLGAAQEHAGIAALARVARPHRGGGGDAARDRGRGGAVRPAAARGRRGGGDPAPGRYSELLAPDWSATPCWASSSHASAASACMASSPGSRPSWSSRGCRSARPSGSPASWASARRLGRCSAPFIADRLGRVRSLAGLALCEAVLGAVYPMVGNGIELIAVGFGVTLCAYAIVAVGFALYIPEMFPTRLRLRGASVVLGISRLTSSQVGFVIVLVFGAFGIGGVAGFLVRQHGADGARRDRAGP